MKPLEALTSILPTASFHATVDGEIIDSNAPFVQLMRCVPGDDWRRNVAEEDRTLLDTFWDRLFGNSNTLHQPLSFLVHGSDDVYQVRAQAVSNDAGEPVSAVGVIMVAATTTKNRWEVDPATGLPVHNAVIEQFDVLKSLGKPFVAAVVLLDDEDSKDETRRKEAARQLLSVVRPSDMLASEADGRFLLCAAGVRSAAAASALAERAIDSLADSSILARAGIALPDPDVATATLVREAEAGAYASEPGSFSFAPTEA